MNRSFFVLLIALISNSTFSSTTQKVITLDQSRVTESFADLEASEPHIVVQPSSIPIVHPGPEMVTSVGDHTMTCQTTSPMGGVGGWKANTWYDFKMCNPGEVVVGGGAECVTGPLRAIHASTKGLNFIAVKCHNEGGVWVRVTCCK